MEDCIANYVCLSAYRYLDNVLLFNASVRCFCGIKKMLSMKWNFLQKEGGSKPRLVAVVYTSVPEKMQISQESKFHSPELLWSFVKLIFHYCKSSHMSCNLLCYRKESHHTHGHTWTSPLFLHSHTYLCSARFIVNITHQHNNDRTLQAVYCYACYLVGLLVIM